MPARIAEAERDTVFEKDGEVEARPSLGGTRGSKTHVGVQVRETGTLSTIYKGIYMVICTGGV